MKGIVTSVAMAVAINISVKSLSGFLCMSSRKVVVAMKHNVNVAFVFMIDDP